MATTPDGIRVGRHRDLAGRGWHVWVRRTLLGLLAAFVLAALVGAFGQRPSTDTVASGSAGLEVYAPERVRGGILWQARFTIRARRDLADARLVLSSGWLEQNTVNTIEPSPLGEASRNGDLSLDLGHVPRGQRYVLYLDFQTNPTNLGRRAADTTLFDGGRRLLTVHRTLTVFP